jgi:SHAQKYF class myb-like DNA-binding protein
VNAVSCKDRREAEKAAKPSRNTGRWTAEEHDEFLKCLDIYGREWKKAAERITTRTAAQIRSHAEKYFQKIEAAGETVPAKKARKIEAPVRSSGRARTAPKKMDV